MDVRDEPDRDPEMAGGLPLVVVTDQSVGHEVVPETIGVVAGARGGAGPGVSGDSEDRRHAGHLVEEGEDRDLRRGGITAGIGDPGGPHQLLAEQLGKPVLPGVVEPMVGGDVDDHRGLADGGGEAVARPVGEGEEHRVEGRPRQVVGADRLVGDLLLAWHRLPGELTGPGKCEIERGMSADQSHQRGPGVAASPDNPNPVEISHRRPPGKRARSMQSPPPGEQYARSRSHPSRRWSRART